MWLFKMLYYKLIFYVYTFKIAVYCDFLQGTEIYDAKHGAFIDLSILDVLQIFGRAGRPQFDSSGHGTIITTHSKLSHYLSLLTNQFPIESNFIAHLADNLNAEVIIYAIISYS